MTSNSRYLEPQSVPQALRLLRSQADLSRDRAAELADVDPRTLSRYESPDAVRIDVVTLRRLIVAYAEQLAIPPEALWRELGDLLDAHVSAARILDAQAEVLRGDDT